MVRSKPKNIRFRKHRFSAWEGIYHVLSPRIKYSFTCLGLLYAYQSQCLHRKIRLWVIRGKYALYLGHSIHSFTHSFIFKGYKNSSNITKNSIIFDFKMAIRYYVFLQYLPIYFKL